MAVNNPWLNPLQRSYNDIKNALINRLSTRVPEITDKSEANIFILILSMFAALAEVLHYYIDNMARETFLTTARRYSSVYKHSKLVDYHIKCANPASVDVTLYTTDNTPLVADVIIPIHSLFTDVQGNSWRCYKTYTWPKGTYSSTVSLVNSNPISETDVDFGTVTSSDIQIPITNIPANYYYVESSMVLKVGGETWELVDTFAYSGPLDKHYKVELTETQVPTIVFGDGSKGYKPLIGSPIQGLYDITLGSGGNITENQFEQVPTEVITVAPNAGIKNEYPASGGTNYEDFETIKNNIPLSVKTLGVAITKDDYEAISKMVPGVDKSFVNYICGRYLEVYISPSGGGVASEALLFEVSKKLSHSKVITTSITTKSTRDIQIYLEANVTGKKSYLKSDINNQVVKTLLDNYNTQTSEINKPVRLSDLYSMIDQLSMVDYLTITTLYLIPVIYIEASNVEQIPLSFEYYRQYSYNSNSSYQTCIVEILDVNNYQVTTSTGDTYQSKFNQALEITTPIFSITIQLSNEQGVTNPGDRFRFYVQHMNQDLQPYNYTIPKITSNNVNLTINETV